MKNRRPAPQAARIRRAGLKVTPQRFAILEYLERHPTHPAADEIFRALNRLYPKTSRATVYNTVSALERAGLIQSVCMDDGVCRYDSNLSPHHHFICKRCGRIDDVTGAQVSARLRLSVRHRIESYELILRGVCRRCMD